MRRSQSFIPLNLQGCRLHIVAHSMGSYVLHHALQNMDATVVSNLSQQVSSVMFAAPDVDRAGFEGMIRRIMSSTEGSLSYFDAMLHPSMLSHFNAVLHCSEHVF